MGLTRSKINIRTYVRVTLIIAPSAAFARASASTELTSISPRPL